MTDYELPQKIASLYEAMKQIPAFKDMKCAKSFDGYMKGIKLINTFNSVEKYRVVFIGGPGKGKTTAICHWLGLLKQDKTDIRSISSLPLLSTGSGRTTVGEVHIKQVSEPSNIELEYMDIALQKDYIKECCKNYYEECTNDKASAAELAFDSSNNDDSGKSKENETIHAETDRVVLNMAGLKNLDILNREIHKEELDDVVKFVKSFADADAFYEHILEKINLPNRNCNQLTYSGEKPYDQWLSDTFNQVNYGMHPECSIVTKVHININSADLDMHLPKYISEIIDTVGLDSTGREDLQKLMQAEDTICFLIDDLENVPTTTIRKLIERAFLKATDAYKYCILKTSIFVAKAKDEELAAVNGINGACEDPDIGRDIKLGEVRRIIKANGVPYESNNTLILNACMACNPTEIKEFDNKAGKFKRKHIIEYDEDNAADYCMEVNNKLAEIVKNLKQSLQHDAEKTKLAVEKLLEIESKLSGEQMTQELHETGQKLTSWRKNLVPQFRGQNVKKRLLLELITSQHHMSINKMNRYYGYYHKYNSDGMYTVIKLIGREELSNELCSTSSFVNTLLDDIDNQDAKVIAQGYIQQYNAIVKETIDKTGLEYYKWAREECFAPQNDTNPFWNHVIRIHGTGYKDMQRDCYERQIAGDCDMLAEKITQKVFKIIDELSAMFKSE